jgi:hypothetical protein
MMKETPMAEDTPKVPGKATVHGIKQDAETATEEVKSTTGRARRLWAAARNDQEVKQFEDTMKPVLTAGAVVLAFRVAPDETIGWVARKASKKVRSVAARAKEQVEPEITTNA